MSKAVVSHLPDADMQAVPQALQRAALRAREIARQTGTPLVVTLNGVLMELDPDSVDLDQPHPPDTIHDRD